MYARERGNSRYYLRPVAPEKPFPFLSLPPELRNMVYKYLFDPAPPAPDALFPADETLGALNLLLASAQIRHEAGLMVRELVFARTNRWHRRDLERLARGFLALPPELRPRDLLEGIAGPGVVGCGDGEVAEGAAAVGAADDGLPHGGSSPAEDERDAADARAERETEPWRKLELALHLHLPYTAPATRPWSLSLFSPARGSAPASASSSPSPPWSSPSTPTSLPPPPPHCLTPAAEYLDTAADYAAAAWDAAELMPHLRELAIVLPARRADSPRGFAELLARSMSMDVALPGTGKFSVQFAGGVGGRYGWRVEPVDCGVRLVGGAAKGGRVVRVRCVAEDGGGEALEVG